MQATPWIFGARRFIENSLRATEVLFYPQLPQAQYKIKTSIPDFQFYFNNNDINSSPDLTRIFPIERISKMSKVPAFKMLGIYFDENLSFDYHIKQTRNKVSKSVFYLNRAKNILTGKALKSLYFALIHPHILYCLPIYSCSSKSNINSLYFLKDCLYGRPTENSFV